MASGIFSSASQLGLASGRVAIVVQPGRFGCHIGLAFHGREHKLALLHLGWHRDIREEPFPRPAGLQIAAECAMPRLCSMQVTAILRCIASNNPAIEYGFNIATRHVFDRRGRFLRSKARGGLTCATFVIEVFRAVSLRIVDENTWPADGANTAWMQAVAQLLQQKESMAYAKRAMRDFDGRRLKPEEVAYAAAICGTPPMHNRDAVRGGKQVATLLDQMSERPPA